MIHHLMYSCKLKSAYRTQFFYLQQMAVKYILLAKLHSNVLYIFSYTELLVAKVAMLNVFDV